MDEAILLASTTSYLSETWRCVFCFLVCNPHWFADHHFQIRLNVKYAGCSREVFVKFDSKPQFLKTQSSSSSLAVIHLLMLILCQGYLGGATVQALCSLCGKTLLIWGISGQPPPKKRNKFKKKMFTIPHQIPFHTPLPSLFWPSFSLINSPVLPSATSLLQQSTDAICPSVHIGLQREPTALGTGTPKRFSGERGESGTTG